MVTFTFQARGMTASAIQFRKRTAMFDIRAAVLRMGGWAGLQEDSDRQSCKEDLAGSKNHGRLRIV